MNDMRPARFSEPRRSFDTSGFVIDSIMGTKMAQAQLTSVRDTTDPIPVIDSEMPDGAIVLCALFRIVVIFLNVSRKSDRYAQTLCHQCLTAVVGWEDLRTKALSRSLFIKAFRTGLCMISRPCGFWKNIRWRGSRDRLRRRSISSRTCPAISCQVSVTAFAAFSSRSLGWSVVTAKKRLGMDGT